MPGRQVGSQASKQGRQSKAQQRRQRRCCGLILELGPSPLCLAGRTPFGATVEQPFSNNSLCGPHASGSIPACASGFLFRALSLFAAHDGCRLLELRPDPDWGGGGSWLQLNEQSSKSSGTVPIRGVCCGLNNHRNQVARYQFGGCVAG